MAKVYQNVASMVGSRPDEDDDGEVNVAVASEEIGKCGSLQFSQALRNQTILAENISNPMVMNTMHTSDLRKQH